MQATNPGPASADAGSTPAITALLNRAKSLLLTQAWLNKPLGVAFAQGSINAYKAMQGGGGDFVASRDAESPVGYLPNAMFKAAWASLPDDLEYLSTAQVQEFLQSHGVQLAADTVANGNLCGGMKLKDDMVTTIDQHDKHDVATANVGDGAGCHGEALKVESPILAHSAMAGGAA